MFGATMETRRSGARKGRSVSSDSNLLHASASTLGAAFIATSRRIPPSRRNGAPSISYPSSPSPASGRGAVMHSGDSGSRYRSNMQMWYGWHM